MGERSSEEGGSEEGIEADGRVYGGHRVVKICTRSSKGGRHEREEDRSCDFIGS